MITGVEGGKVLMLLTRISWVFWWKQRTSLQLKYWEYSCQRSDHSMSCICLCRALSYFHICLSTGEELWEEAFVICDVLQNTKGDDATILLSLIMLMSVALENELPQSGIVWSIRDWESKIKWHRWRRKDVGCFRSAFLPSGLEFLLPLLIMKFNQRIHCEIKTRLLTFFWTWS